METTKMLNGMPVKDPRKGITQPKPTAAPSPPRPWKYRQWWPTRPWTVTVTYVRGDGRENQTFSHLT